MFLGLWLHHSNLCLHCCKSFSPASLNLNFSLIKTPVILYLEPIQVWPHFNFPKSTKNLFLIVSSSQVLGRHEFGGHSSYVLMSSTFHLSYHSPNSVLYHHFHLTISTAPYQVCSSTIHSESSKRQLSSYLCLL